MEKMVEYNTRQHLENFFACALVYFASLALVVYFTGPVERLFNSHIMFASVLFLPHGVRVLAALVFGPTLSFLYLLPLHIISVIIAPYSTDLLIYDKFFQAFVASGCAPLALYIVTFLLGEELATLKTVNTRSWRIILLIIVISAVINGVGQAAIVERSLDYSSSINLAVSYFTGDVFGSIVTIYLAYLVLRRFKFIA